MARNPKTNLLLTGLVFALILSFVGPLNIEPNSLRNTAIVKKSHTKLLANYTEHAPILIESDPDFQTQGWPGNGSVSNPYVIAGLNITNDEDCIQIHYTSAHFVIRDCYLGSDSSWNDLLSLRYSGNALIEDCILMTQFNGIVLYESDNVVLRDTVIASNRGPIRAMSSNGFKVSNCTFPDLELMAFPLRFTLDNCINAFVNKSEFHKVFIDTRGSILTSITSCNFTDGGLLLSWNSPSTFTVFSDNYVNGKPLLMLNGNDSLVIEAEDYGQIVLLDCSNILVQNGNMSNTRPLQLMKCVGCTIQNITAWYGYSGIYDYRSNYTTIRNCTFNGVFSGGVFMTQSSHSLVENCNAVPGDNYPFSSRFIVQSCTNTTMAQCTIEAIKNEALRFSGTSMRLTECIIEGARYGILVSGSNMTIDKNHIHSMSTENVHPRYSVGIQASIRNSTISNNLIENGDDRGIFAVSNDSLFMNNSIINNDGIGIELFNSSNGNSLYGNILKHNLLGNALDNGFDNQWDDGISIGNLWDDFNPHTHSQYNIPGAAGSVDRFPKTDTEYPTEIPSTSSPTTPTPTESPQQQWIVIIAVISIVGVCLVVLVFRLKR